MKTIAHLFLFLSIIACTGDVVDPKALGEIEIRVWNASGFTLEEVYVDTNGGHNDYGNLVSNNRSDYKPFMSAYRYAFVSFKINGKAYTIQPIDYVGEDLLEKGKYTYKLSVSNLNSQYALLEFIEDN